MFSINLIWSSGTSAPQGTCCTEQRPCSFNPEHPETRPVHTFSLNCCCWKDTKSNTFKYTLSPMIVCVFFSFFLWFRCNILKSKQWTDHFPSPPPSEKSQERRLIILLIDDLLLFFPWKKRREQQTNNPWVKSCDEINTPQLGQCVHFGFVIEWDSAGRRRKKHAP